MRVLRLKLRGKWWRIGFTDRKTLRDKWNETNPRDRAGCGIKGAVWHGQRVMLLAPHESRRDLMDTIVHEVLHVEDPEMTHQKVQRLAASCAKVLDRLL